MRSIKHTPSASTSASQPPACKWLFPSPCSSPSKTAPALRTHPACLTAVQGCARQPRIHQAFTLIELLVSVAIIIILMAVIFPIITTVKDSVHRSDSLQKMRNIGAAMQNYLADTGSLPGPMYTGQNAFYTKVKTTLAGHLLEYMESPPRIYTTEPKQMIPALVTSRYMQWYEENRDLGGSFNLYRTRESIVAGGARSYPWGYPGDNDKKQTEFSTILFRAGNDSRGNLMQSTWLIGDDYSPFIASHEQNFKTRLYLDWRIEIIPASDL